MKIAFFISRHAASIRPEKSDLMKASVWMGMKDTPIGECSFIYLSVHVNKSLNQMFTFKDLLNDDPYVWEKILSQTN